MRTQLTIGEAARLLNMSTSQIRFYEKKELVKPASIDDNGYRLYGFEELDELEAIALLRNLNVSIEEVKLILEVKNNYSYMKVLEASKLSIEEEIHKLNNKLAEVNHKIKHHKEFLEIDCEVIHMPQRVLQVIDRSEPSITYPKDVYDFVSWHDLDYMDPKAVILDITTPKGLQLFCFYSADDQHVYKLEQYVLETGNYYSMNVQVNHDVKVETMFEELERKAWEKGYTLGDAKIVIQDLNLSTYSSEKTYIKVQRKITGKVQ